MMVGAPPAVPVLEVASEEDAEAATRARVSEVASAVEVISEVRVLSTIEVTRIVRGEAVSSALDDEDAGGADVIEEAGARGPVADCSGLLSTWLDVGLPCGRKATQVPVGTR